MTPVPSRLYDAGGQVGLSDLLLLTSVLTPLGFGVADGLGSAGLPGGVIGLLPGAAAAAACFMSTRAVFQNAFRFIDGRKEPGKVEAALVVAGSWLLLLGTAAWIGVVSASAGFAAKRLVSLLLKPATAQWLRQSSTYGVFGAAWVWWHGLSGLRRMALTFFVPLPPLIGLIVARLVIFDGLLRIQFKRARAEWEKDGRPRGYFFSPPGAVKMGIKERGVVFGRWENPVPDWINADGDASRLHGRLWALLLPTMVCFVPVFLAGCGLLVGSFFWTVGRVTGIDFGQDCPKTAPKCP